MHTTNDSLDLIVKNRSTSDLTSYAKNSRLHSAEQIEQIAESITLFGFVNPILLDETDTIIAGHGRLAAAKLLKLETVPTITLSHLSDTQRRALIIADNQIAANATFDYAILKFELEALDNAGFDIECVGFSIGELANIFDPEGSDNGQEIGPEEIPDPKPVTCPECACSFIPKKGKKNG